MNNKQPPAVVITYIAATIGLADSIYLTIIKFTENKNLCIQGVGDCWSVNNSVYSEFYGIPISILGAAAYLTILLLTFVGSRNHSLKETTHLITFGMTLAGSLYSVYLTYLEVAVLKAICPFCVLSAIAMLTLFAITCARLLKPQAEPKP
ncbi:MAG: vitamin K epoxide reductase family protein [Chloroflexi bacterium]|jgi:uncharacterized membrane protein|nr:vitamin K epoxide reductase family protein [Anaerolineaceae bacterium]NMB88969.1 vitamin K epoxide reductase family protein [Chloroflexota bacterium]